MMKQLALSAAILSVAVAAQASDEPRRKAPDPEQRVCKQYKLTGSRLSVRTVCKKRREWDDYDPIVEERLKDKTPLPPETLGSS